MKEILHTIVCVLAISTVSGSVEGAEFRLRSQCTPQGSIVVLGDVAEILASDTKQVESLKQIELFPAPVSDQPRVLRVRELQDSLMLRGVNLVEHRFSGSSTVQIESAKKVSSETKGPISAQVAKQVERRMQETVQKYLQERSTERKTWLVQFELTPAQQRLLANPMATMTLDGGESPWVGEQTFEVTVDTKDGPARFALNVRVSEPTSVVAAVRSLPRGAIIQESDLTLVSAVSNAGKDREVFRTVEEVAGKQASKSIAEGKVLTADFVQAPLLVQRGDIVTVYARSAGIRVRTTARAKDNGALNDLVAVESLTDRKSFTARVSGPRETEVFAEAVSAR